MRSLIVALRYPFFGIGMGNFHFRGFQEKVSHNAYTQVAAEMGLVALVIYAKFLIVPLNRTPPTKSSNMKVSRLRRPSFQAKTTTTAIRPKKPLRE